MAEIVLRDGEVMMLDDECLPLFSNKSLYAVKSRNAVYACYGKNGRAHRLICGATSKGLIVDHINGNGLDNRRANLRIVSSVVNVKNRQHSRSKTGLPPGVFKFRNGYMAQVTNDYKKIFLGVFTDLNEAVEALNKKRAELGRPPYTGHQHRAA